MTPERLGRGIPRLNLARGKVHFPLTPTQIQQTRLHSRLPLFLRLQIYAQNGRIGMCSTDSSSFFFLFFFFVLHFLKINHIRWYAISRNAHSSLGLCPSDRKVLRNAPPYACPVHIRSKPHDVSIEQPHSYSSSFHQCDGEFHLYGDNQTHLRGPPSRGFR